MPKKKNQNKKQLYIKLGVIAVIIISFCISLLFNDQLTRLINFKYGGDGISHQSTYEDIFGGDYYVSYLNVGQGSSTFAMLPNGETLLIDGGNTQYGSTVCEYLEKHNIETIDYLVATHADADHIGGLNSVLKNYEVKNIYRPFQIALDKEDNSKIYADEKLAPAYNYYGSNSKISKVDTNVYREFITAIYSEEYTENGEKVDSTVTVFYDGLKITGVGFSIEFFAPLVRDDNYNLFDSTGTYGYATIGYGANESNQNSAMFLLTCGNDKYFFSGDAEFTDGTKKTTGFAELDFYNSLTTKEKQLLSEVDVFMLGHHGSKYSSGEQILKLLSPEFIIISVGKNSYGHPTKETLERVSKVDGLADDYLLRTDECGTITFSDVNGMLMYFREIASDGTPIQTQRVSWAVIGGSATVVLCVIVLSINVKKEKRRARGR